MIRLLGYLTLAIVILYSLEFFGVIEKRKYFPSLPRLENKVSENNTANNTQILESSQEQTQAEATAPVNYSFTERVANRQLLNEEKPVADMRISATRQRIIGALPIRY